MADENHRIGSERVVRRARVLAWTAIVALTWLAAPGGVLAHGGDAAGTTPSDDSKAAFEDMRGRGVTSGEHPGAALYEVHCARCHSKRVARAPDRSFLEMMPGDRILAALNDGVMRQMAAAMTPEQRAQVAEYLGGSLDASPEFPPLTCAPGASPFDFDRPPPMAGWGMGLDNRRHVPADVAGLSVADVAQLELKWAFAVPGANRVRSQPGVAGGGLYFGAPDGTVYALDAKTGCVRWTFRAGAEVRTGVTISPWVAGETPERHPVGYFADLVAWVYAVDLVTGELKWKVKVDEHPTATTTAQPQLVDGVLYQPVSSLEEAAAADPAYECCTFRGSVVALDARTGKTIWKRYTIPAPPSPYERDGYPGRTFYGPSGAPVWNTPTIDLEAGRMYVATGDNYSSPADRNSDAVIAFDLPSGERAWTSQATAGDAWTVACMGFIDDKGNCPVEKGPDVDFASPPALVDLPGGRYLVAGQKSGVALGMDADTGEILWRRKVGRGGNQGGINFGMAVDGDRLLVPVADFDDGELPIEEARPGLYGLDVATGAVQWSTPADDVCGPRGEDCDPGISQAITAIDGAVFAGHLDGRLRAYDTTTGKVMWEFDTWREFDTLSGETARGGSFSGGSGPVIVDGMVYASSGYGIYFHMPGNVVLAFGLPDGSEGNDEATR